MYRGLVLMSGVVVGMFLLASGLMTLQVEHETVHRAWQEVTDACRQRGMVVEQYVSHLQTLSQPTPHLVASLRAANRNAGQLIPGSVPLRDRDLRELADLQDEVTRLVKGCTANLPCQSSESADLLKQFGQRLEQSESRLCRALSRYNHAAQLVNETMQRPIAAVANALFLNCRQVAAQHFGV